MINYNAIDRSALDRLTEWGGDKLLRQMLRLFLENAPERLQQIEQGLAPGGALEEAHRGAHSLKSSAGNVGAMSLSEKAAALEASTKQGDAEASQSLFAELKVLWNAVEAELSQVLEGLPE